MPSEENGDWAVAQRLDGKINSLLEMLADVALVLLQGVFSRQTLEQSQERSEPLRSSSRNAFFTATAHFIPARWGCRVYSCIPQSHRWIARKFLRRASLHFPIRQKQGQRKAIHILGELK